MGKTSILILLLCLNLTSYSQHLFDGLIEEKIAFITKEEIAASDIKRIDSHDETYHFVNSRLATMIFKDVYGEVVDTVRIEYSGNQVKSHYMNGRGKFNYTYDKTGKVSYILNEYAQDTLWFHYDDFGNLINYPVTICFPSDKFEDLTRKWGCDQSSSCNLYYNDANELTHGNFETDFLAYQIENQESIFYIGWNSYLADFYEVDTPSLLIDSVPVFNYIERTREVVVDFAIIELLENYYLFVSRNVGDRHSGVSTEEITLNGHEFSIEHQYRIFNSYEDSFFNDYIAPGSFPGEKFTVVIDSRDTIISQAANTLEFTENYKPVTQLDDGRIIVMQVEASRGITRGLCGGASTSNHTFYQLEGNDLVSIGSIWSDDCNMATSVSFYDQSKDFKDMTVQGISVDPKGFIKMNVIAGEGEEEIVFSLDAVAFKKFIHHKNSDE